MLQTPLTALVMMGICVPKESNLYQNSQVMSFWKGCKSPPPRCLGVEEKKEPQMISSGLTSDVASLNSLHFSVNVG